MAEHEIETLEREDGGWVAVCSCSNPDSDGAGAAEFRGDTALLAVTEWLDHYDGVPKDGRSVWPFPA